MPKARKKKAAPRDWAVYIVRCNDGSLYTGVAKDVASRIAKHNSGKGAAYTRAHRPVVLRYRELGFTHSQALVREAEIKRLPPRLKRELAESHRGVTVS